MRKRKLACEQLEVRRLLAFNPTAQEQEFLQLTNRFRTDPRGEYARLISSTSPIRSRDSDLQPELDGFNVNGSTLRSELGALQPTHPVGWHEGIQSVVAAHNAKMVSERRQFHSDTLTRRQQLLDAGVNLRFRSGEKINSENVYGFAKSAHHLHASYVIDWGPGPGGMQTNRPHRAAVINSDFEQLGAKLTNVGGTGFGPVVNTQVLANIEDPPVMAIGAIFEDTNGTGWYEAGEGISGVSIKFEGPAGTFTTSAMSAGGYQIELPAGTYKATATGGRLKFPVIVTGITVGSTNVWRNLIYDPTKPPPDRFENNNSRATATDVGSSDQTESSLSIHTSNDNDYFKFVPNGSGNGQVTARFTHSEGDLQLQILSSTGRVLDSSTDSGNSETVSYQLVRGATYFARVYGASGAINANYQISFDLPEPQRPTASDDSDEITSTGSTSIAVLGNDSDPDGNDSALRVNLDSNAPSGFSVTSSQQVRYQPPAGTHGVVRARYTVTDDQNLESTPATVSVFVIDFEESNPWHNKAKATDVNEDGITSAIDVLLIINDINQNNSRTLETSGQQINTFGFVDTNGDGLLSPIDALLPINELNGQGSGEGEGKGEAAAFWQFALEDPHFQEEEKNYDQILEQLAVDISMLKS